jgi:hypothetical protein
MRIITPFFFFIIFVVIGLFIYSNTYAACVFGPPGMTASMINDCRNTPYPHSTLGSINYTNCTINRNSYDAMCGAYCSGGTVGTCIPYPGTGPAGTHQFDDGSGGISAESCSIYTSSGWKNGSCWFPAGSVAPSCSSAGGTCQTVSVCNYMGGTGKSGYNCANTCCFVPSVCEQRGGYCADAYHGGSCSSSYYPNGTLGCTGTAPFCCYPKYLAPTCDTITSCTPWTAVNPPNSCNMNNSARDCTLGSYSGGGYCNTTYTTQYRTINCSATYNCINNRCYTNITAHVFMDFNADGTQNNGEPGVNGNNVSFAGTNRTTNGSGNAVSPNLTPGTYSVSASTPTGYTGNIQTTTANPVSVNLGSGRTVNFGFTPLYSISGVLYNDINKNGQFDTGIGESLAGTISIIGPSYPQTTNISVNGVFTVQNLRAGTYTVSTKPPSASYTFIKGTLSSYTVTVGTPGTTPACNANGSIATCDGVGDITGVYFQLSNENPSTVTVCADFRSDNGITNPVPANGTCGGVTNSYASITDGGTVCNTPGILFSGDSAATFAPGQASTTNQLVGGGGNYAESFKSVNPRTIRTSYQYMTTTAHDADIQMTPLETVCDLADCTLPLDLASGVYIASSDAVLNTYTFPLNKQYVFLIDGNLTIMGNILVPTGSTATFTVSGNIIVDKSVGETDVTSRDANIQGFYSTDNSFVINSYATTTQTCNPDGSTMDKRLNIVGSVVVNAAGTQGTFTNSRDLCLSDTQCPTVSMSLANGNASGNRPGAGNGASYLLNAPSFIKHPNTVWQELVP